MRLNALQSVYRATHISAVASKPADARTPLEVSKLANELTRVPLLATLDDASLRKLAEEVRLQVHLPGSVIMRQGDPGDRMFLLTEGSVNVMKMPEEQLAVINNLGAWAACIEPVLKDSAQARPSRSCDLKCPFPTSPVGGSKGRLPPEPWSCVAISALQLVQVPLDRKKIEIR